MIYLDYSANTPVDPAVLNAFCEAERNYIGNPNSAHCAGKAAREEMARATDSIAKLLGVLPSEIIYTSGASESNNLALKGIAQASQHTGRHIISTALEHFSVGGALSALQRQGCEIDLVGIEKSGMIDLEELNSLLREDTIAYLRKSDFHFDAVSMDCTLARGSNFTSAHMDILQCRETADLLRDMGRIDERTVLLLSHIGHLIDRTHDELSREAAELGFIVAYDTMTLEI